MAKYVVKRVLLAFVTVIVISLITFFAMNAIPGGPFNKEKAVNEAVIRQLEARYNLDKPLWEQYILYMKNLAHGDFGVSLKNNREISDIFAESFPISAKIGLIAAVIAIISGIVLGSIAALMRNKWPDRVIIFFITIVTSMPSFVVATLLLYYFCMVLGMFQAFSAGENMTVLPVIALSLSPMAYITRLTKTSMLDALGQDYIRTAKAKGVSPSKVIFVHGLRNALIPVITYVGPMIAGILTGSMVVEAIFNLGGLGSKFVSAITNRDYTLIMATTIFLATVMVIANLLTDIVYKIIDPRIKLD
ncbi:oligopeptide transport system permease protein [Pseudobutyrivibrio sp. ACV-2]|uniref:ABC transporter permease n=1 Tax=Pseudobutyrivibrio sp. ACV-2 TaxID=1520801 RepID=UPI000895D582|nr:ABC transporter permease [Pseudobutyrivibrio sp. ACV-2]SEA85676.1 oligopeptide transport system permease protein [Pseudobutyrivibrio sp. ACV-2]